MKKYLIAIAALAFMAWGCSKSEEEEAKPAPQIVKVEASERPHWQEQAPNFDQYEQFMNVEVRLQETLQSYASSNDLMSATINGQVRGVSKPKQVDGRWVFSLFVASDHDGVNVSLSYYCDKLHSIYTLSNWTKFDANTIPLGTGDIYEPTFIN